VPLLLLLVLMLSFDPAGFLADPAPQAVLALLPHHPLPAAAQSAAPQPHLPPQQQLQQQQ
jgi:hypothetical protein